MRVGIVGAGAIGGWIGIRLSAAGHDVSVFARGATLAALRSGPWRLASGGAEIATPVQASDNPASLGVQDMLVIALKGPALPDAAPHLSPMIGAQTAIVTAMNGVPWWFLLGNEQDVPRMALRSADPTGAIAATLPFGQIAGCVVHASAAVVSPGVVAHKAGNRLILGAASSASGPLAQAACDALAGAGFDVEHSARIQNDIWYKLWGNMTMNPISALTGATCDRILDDADVSAFVLRIMAEAQAVGARIGCPIRERGEDRNAVTRKLGAFKTSMLQDAESGKPLELDTLLGAPLEIAGQLRLDTPDMSTLMGLVRLFGQSRGIYGVHAPVVA